MHTENCIVENLPFSKLFKEYTHESPSLSPFFDRFPSELFKDEIQRNENIEREQLAELLAAFNADFELSESSKNNLSALSKNNTYTVVTGQQIGLFGGYLYTVYKIISSILYAKKLAEHHKVLVVPIFWVADEDHDFEEANHVFVPTHDTATKIEIERFSTINQQAGRELLPETIKSKIDEFFEISGNTDHSSELRSWFETIYVSKKSQKQAFLELINKIFGKYGLIFFGSDNKQVKQASIPVLKQAIEQVEYLYETLENQTLSIEKTFHRQAQIDLSNLFLNTGDGRVKLRYNSDDGLWSTGDENYSKEELLELVSTSPELFSPNVFLRPIIQEFILPNLAYVAGPGEIAYYAQTKTFFEAFNLKMPVIIPRLSATIIEKAFHRYWSDLPIQFSDYFQRIEDLESDLVHRMQPIDLDAKFQQWNDEILNISEGYKQAISDIDGSLEQTVDRALNSFGNELQKVKGKVVKSIKQKDDVNLQRMRKIHASIYPNNHLQERLIGFAHYLNKYGVLCFDSIIERDYIDNHKQHMLFFLE